MQLKLRHPAPAHTIYDAGMAKSILGQSFLAKNQAYPVGVGLVIAARVVEDGRALELTIEWPEEEQRA